MQVKLRMGYDTVLITASGSEVDVLNNLLGKAEKVNTEYLEADPAIGRDRGEYVMVKAPEPFRPELEVLIKPVKVFQSEWVEEANKKAKAAKAQQEG